MAAICTPMVLPDDPEARLADELAARGVEHLPEAVRAAGFAHRHDALLDQAAATPAQMDGIVDWLNQALSSGGRVAVHCMAGLGRSGMAAACYLARGGMAAEQAIQLVRDRRSPRAIETAAQAAFVADYARRGKE